MFKVRCRGASPRSARPSHQALSVTTSTCFAVHPCAARSGRSPPDGNGGSPMLAFVRAACAAALVLLLSVPANRRRQAVQTRRSRRRGDQAGSPDQGRGRPGDQARRRAAARGRRRLPAQRFPQRHADPRADRGGRARRQRQLAAPRQGRAADPPEQRPRDAACCSSAPRPPPTSPISAPAIPARRPKAWW